MAFRGLFSAKKACSLAHAAGPHPPRVSVAVTAAVLTQTLTTFVPEATCFWLLYTLIL